MKKILFFCAMLMFSPFVRAQFSSVMAEDPNYIGNYSIVRRLSDSEVITYVRDDNHHQFTYENSSTLTYNYFDLPSPEFDKIIVEDFKIIDDMLFYCGENVDSNKGVVGTFYATSLQSLGALVQVDYYYIDNTTDLDALEVYIDPVTNMPRLAVVGYNRVGNCGIWACGVLVDCDGCLPGVAPTSITVFESYYVAPNEMEQWQDVVATDNWVALVGYGHIGGRDGIIFRRYPKGNPFGTETKYFYFYAESESPIAEEIHALYLRDEDIAIAYRSVRDDNVSDVTKFRIFDIGLMSNVNSQEYVVPYKSQLGEMAYMKKADIVALLNFFSSPNYIANFVYMIPYQMTPYNSVFVHDDRWDFGSVTNLDGNYFVGSGCLHFLLRNAAAGYPANNDYTGTPALCPEDIKLMVMIIDNVELTKTPNTLVFLRPPILPNIPSSIVRFSTMGIKCYSF